MFQLDKKEAKLMVSQNAIPSWKHLGGYLPYVFTEQGVAMLSTVLNSDRAIQVNIAIMRAFVRLRQILSTHKIYRDAYQPNREPVPRFAPSLPDCRQAGETVPFCLDLDFLPLYNSISGPVFISIS